MYEQEGWAYKYVDHVYGFPTLVRYTFRKVRSILAQQSIYIHWFDRKEEHLKLEHCREKFVAVPERDTRV